MSVDGAANEAVQIGGYVQPQLAWTAEGAAFRVRRARPKLTFTPSADVRIVFELDPFPTGGPAEGTGTIARDTTASYRTRLGAGFALTVVAGIFKVPLSAELIESSSERPFVERSWASRNWFPSERDTGLWARVSSSRNTIDFAILNGVVQGEPSFAIVPVNDRRKDVLLRLRRDLGPAAIGVAGYLGTAETNQHGWLSRWAVRMESLLRLRLGARPTEISSELTVASNLDRGVRYSFAAPSAAPLLQRGFFVRVEQPIGESLRFGVRFDHYSPDASLPANARNTLGAVAAVAVAPGLRLLAEVSYARDNVRARGEPEPQRVLYAFSLTAVAKL